jgi:hypothetical protein
VLFNSVTTLLTLNFQISNNNRGIISIRNRIEKTEKIEKIPLQKITDKNLKIAIMQNVCTNPNKIIFLLVNQNNKKVGALERNRNVSHNNTFPKIIISGNLTNS